MDPRLSGVFLLMEELGGFSIKDLEDRVYLQKCIYLLQIFGIDLKYRFRWYLRGPYSKELTQSAFEIESNKELRKTSRQLKLGPSIVPAISELKKLLSQRPKDLMKSQWLELLSSIHYLKHIAKSDVTKENIADHSRISEKSHFNEVVIKKAWDTLESVGLIENIIANRVSPH